MCYACYVEIHLLFALFYDVIVIYTQVGNLIKRWREFKLKIDTILLP